MSKEEILNLKFYCGDLSKEISIQDYFKELLKRLFEEGECFSGKRPFGNSGWQWDIYACFVKNKVIEGKLDEDGYVDNCDSNQADRLIIELIEEIGNGQQLAELKAKLEEVEGQYAYECGCNAQFVECQNENENLKAENERLKKSLLIYANSQQKDNEQISSLLQQLKEKDEEIERLNIQIGALQKDSIRKDNVILMKDKEIVDIKSELTHKKYLLKSNTKQVCEKIRRGIDDIHFNGNHYGYIGLCETHELIDKIIEKGEDDGKR